MTPAPSHTPHVISASRRTDIPRYYARWFAARRKAGHAEFRSAYGVPGRVSLKPEDVLGYLFWTRLSGPLLPQLRALAAEATPFALQFTLTAYGRDLEPHRVREARAIDDFLTVAALLPSRAAIQWRYDPILLSEIYSVDFHRRAFLRLAQALFGATTVVNTSVAEPYLKALRRLSPEANADLRWRKPDPSRHKTVAQRYPHLLTAGDDVAALLCDLAAIARAHGMTLRSCANPEWGLPAAQCCSAELFAPWGLGERLRALRPRPTREGCRCLPSVDIGMDNTCLSGCKYCYVVTSHDAAVAAFRAHSPNAEALRG